MKGLFQHRQRLLVISQLGLRHRDKAIEFWERRLEPFGFIKLLECIRIIALLKVDHSDRGVYLGDVWVGTAELLEHFARTVDIPRSQSLLGRGIVALHVSLLSRRE